MKNNSTNNIRHTVHNQSVQNNSAIECKIKEIKEFIEVWHNQTHPKTKTLFAPIERKKTTTIIKWNKSTLDRINGILKKFQLKVDEDDKRVKILRINNNEVVASVDQEEYNKTKYIVPRLLFKACVKGILLSVSNTTTSHNRYPEFADKTGADIAKFYLSRAQYDKLSRALSGEKNTDTTSEFNGDESQYINALIREYDRVSGREYLRILASHDGIQHLLEKCNKMPQQGAYELIRQAAAQARHEVGKLNLSPHESFIDETQPSNAAGRIKRKMEHMIELHKLYTQYKQTDNNYIPSYISNPTQESSFTLLGQQHAERLSQPQHDFVQKLNTALEGTDNGKINVLNLNLKTGEGKTHLIEMIKKFKNDIIVENYNRDTKRVDVVKHTRARNVILFIDECAHLEQIVLDDIYKRAMTLKNSDKNVVIVNVTATRNKELIKIIKSNDDLQELGILNEGHQREICKKLVALNADLQAETQQNVNILENITNTSATTDNKYTTNISSNINNLIEGRKQQRIQYIMPENKLSKSQDANNNDSAKAKDDSAKDKFLQGIKVDNTLLCILSDDKQRIITYDGTTPGKKRLHDGKFADLATEYPGMHIVTFFDKNNAIGGDFGDNNNFGINKQFLHLHTTEHTNADLEHYLGRNRAVKLHKKPAANVYFTIDKKPKMSWKDFICDSYRTKWADDKLKTQARDELRRLSTIIDNAEHKSYLTSAIQSNSTDRKGTLQKMWECFKNALSCCWCGYGYSDDNNIDVQRPSIDSSSNLSSELASAASSQKKQNGLSQKKHNEQRTGRCVSTRV